MSKKIKIEDNNSNKVNPNEGTSGTNRQYEQDQENRRKQLEANKMEKKISLKDKID